MDFISVSLACFARYSAETRGFSRSGVRFSVCSSFYYIDMNTRVCAVSGHAVSSGVDGSDCSFSLTFARTNTSLRYAAARLQNRVSVQSAKQCFSTISKTVLQYNQKNTVSVQSEKNTVSVQSMVKSVCVNHRHTNLPSGTQAV